MTPPLTDLTLAELDEWIAAAIKERSRRAGPMTSEPPKTVDATAQLLWRTSQIAGGQTLLQLRHAGAGWVSFLLSQAERAAILSTLLQHALAAPAAATARAAEPVTAAPSPPPSPPVPTGGKPH